MTDRTTLKKLMLGAAVAALLAVSPAAAQESKNPLHFLKPWLQKQIFGKDTQQDDAAGQEVFPGAPATSASPDGLPPPPDMATGATGSTGEQAPAAATGEPTPLVDLPEGESPEGESAPATAEAPAQGVPPAAAPTDSNGVTSSDLPPPADAPASEAASAVPSAPMAEPFRFGILAGADAAATLATAGPLADDLGKLLTRPVEFVPLPSYGAMIDAQTGERIDGGFYSAAAFALADTRCSCIEPLVAPRAWDGTLAYHAIIVVRADSGIKSLTDLTGKKVAIGAEDSIGGRRMQLGGLLSEGLDPSSMFGAVIEVDSAQAAVRLLASGGADAAFAWSSLAGRIETGYSRGTLTDLALDGEITMDRLAIVWKSPAIEHGPFAVARKLSDSDKTKIETHLIALATDSPDAYDRLNPLYGGGYAPVDPQDYSGMKALIAQNVDELRLAKQEATSPPPAAPDASTAPAETAPTEEEPAVPPVQ